MDAAQMHLHVSIDCNPPDPDPLPLQQEKPIADESSIGSDAEQEVQEEEGDAEEQNKPIVQEQQVNTTAFMDMTIMADDEQIKWEQQSQHFESKVASISKQHEKQTHHMGQQFENLIHYFDYIMQDQEQHSHDMQTRFRLLLHSLAGKKSVLLTIPSHQRLDGTREASARSNWIRLLVQNHMGNKLDKEEVASAVQQGGEIRKGDILVQDLSDMIDYALALIFEPGTK
ncbi:hypothetical protein LRAMOSA03344 [Lichtheimia ramosa]|uniref:Uncharacterized protein n=1 Tax=Lichtheimia ramosa TaxID=688394 RepID=A0A077WUU0_9FUNG|nr:hypothetical protein LRAMOSA03344 [Lichtheimia ramosa]